MLQSAPSLLKGQQSRVTLMYHDFTFCLNME